MYRRKPVWGNLCRPRAGQRRREARPYSWSSAIDGLRNPGDRNSPGFHLFRRLSAYPIPICSGRGRRHIMGVLRANADIPALRAAPRHWDTTVQDEGCKVDWCGDASFFANLNLPENVVSPRGTVRWGGCEIKDIRANINGVSKSYVASTF